MVKRGKTEAMAVKRCRNKREISLPSGKKRNDKNDTGNDTDPDQAKDKYPLQL